MKLKLKNGYGSHFVVQNEPKIIKGKHYALYLHLCNPLKAILSGNDNFAKKTCIQVAAMAPTETQTITTQRPKSLTDYPHS